MSYESVHEHLFGQTYQVQLTSARDAALRVASCPLVGYKQLFRLTVAQDDIYDAGWLARSNMFYFPE